jgi:hypothetical protein
MDLDAPLAVSALLAEQLWRRAMRSNGWPEPAIRKFERRLNLTMLLTTSAAVIGLTVWLS